MTQMQRGRGWALSTIVGITSLGVGVTPSATAGTFVRAGIEFCEVRAPSNAALTQNEGGSNAGRGAVGYEFGLGRTEVTVEEYFQFVNAHGLVFGASIQSPVLTRGIVFDPSTASGYSMSPGTGRLGATMSWRTAAQYCNWLHNEKAVSRTAFETGAYDVRSFGRLTTGEITDQATRAANARFWIPSVDEWVKGTYFDPNRFGVGRPGYWPHPGSKDRLLNGGLPADGGETDAIPLFLPGGDPLLDVGSYPGILSPWGLLDSSGSLSEMTEGFTPGQTARLAFGSQSSDTTWFIDDDVRSGASELVDPELWLGGLRLATSIPAPSSLFFLVLGSVSICPYSRKRR